MTARGVADEIPRESDDRQVGAREFQGDPEIGRERPGDQALRCEAKRDAPGENGDDDRLLRR